MKVATGERARRALALVESLQARLAGGLEAACARRGDPVRFQRVAWLRDGGIHGGGARLEAGEGPTLNRASVNVSQVHYEDLPDRKLASATALSTIIHPRSPRAPSVHAHVSWTELRDGKGYWRVMADLNPSVEETEDATSFREALRGVAGSRWAAAAAQGDRYFFIPALGRTRGVVHFYLEGLTTGDFEADLAFAERVELAAIDAYLRILGRALAREPVGPAERAAQLAYHTLYLFQVLTLDRGTTSGLLVHDQNDVGILGSLPSHVDRALLASWVERLQPPQDELLRGIVEALPAGQGPTSVDEPTKLRLAAVVRAHYARHPDALALQATGDLLPPTVDNHRPGS